LDSQIHSNLKNVVVKKEVMEHEHLLETLKPKECLDNGEDSIQDMPEDLSYGNGTNLRLKIHISVGKNRIQLITATNHLNYYS